MIAEFVVSIFTFPYFHSSHLILWIYKLQKEVLKTTTTLNLGPTHPATHGVFQNILELDGERIVSAVQTVGYIHRALKNCRRRPLYQYTADRQLIIVHLP